MMQQKIILDTPQQNVILAGTPQQNIILPSGVQQQKVIIPEVPPPPVYDFLEPFEHYGVQWDITNASSALTRIGNMDMHRELPIQRQMKRCLLTDGGGEWLLHEDDSRLMPDGSPADLSGASGQFMEIIPEFYYKVEVEGNIRRIKLAMKPFTGYRKFRKSYFSVAEATVHRPTNRLSSVVNDSAEYRGGNNNASWDLLDKTLLGKPATSLGRQLFRQYALNRGYRWIDLAYHVYNAIRILYFVEYANFNIQLPFAEELTPEGLRQGGLGNGVTNAASAGWSAFSSYHPFVPCGHTVDMGNRSGVKELTIEDFGGSPYTTYVPSYRGIQNFFGHIWQNADGILIKINSNAEGGTSEVYVTESWENFNDTDISVMDYVGDLARGSGYIKNVILGEGAHFLPTQIGAGSTTYYSDYFYTSIPSSGFSLRTLLLGAGANYGANAGASAAVSNYVPTYAYASIGSRLCFLT